MFNNLYITPRFERKKDLLDKQLSYHLSERLEKLAHGGIKSILEQSHKLNYSTESQLWVTRITYDYNLIFRMVDENRIELVDIASRDDLSKFVKESK